MTTLRTVSATIPASDKLERVQVCWVRWSEERNGYASSHPFMWIWTESADGTERAFDTKAEAVEAMADYYRV